MTLVRRGSSFLYVLGFVSAALVLCAGASTALAKERERNITGTGKADSLTGSASDDRIFGHGGDDRIDGRAGDDTVYGGDGRDVLMGARGDDHLFARDGERDQISCGPGRDTVVVDKRDVVAADCESVHRATATGDGSPHAPPTTPAPPGNGPGPTAQCADRRDNDRDGRIDMRDPGCSSPSDNDERNTTPPPAQCADGRDNDGDGRIDMRDPGCSSPSDNDERNTTPPPAQCADGRDNDGDGRIDMSDPGCSSPSDNDETDATPPPSSGGTTLTFTDATWTCTQPVSRYATRGLPLRVVMNYTHNYNGFGVRLGAGCVGDGTNAIDLVLEINGDGLTRGPQEDAIRVMAERPGASNLQITGHANCGRKVIDAIHQDGIQVLGGTNITWVDFRVGDYDAGRSTCQGAGGAFFYSLASTNTVIQGGKYIACNHSLLAGNGSGRVSGASFRSGRNDGSDPACNYNSSEPCIFQSPSIVKGPGVTCQRWHPPSRRWIDQ